MPNYKFEIEGRVSYRDSRTGKTRYGTVIARFERSHAKCYVVHWDQSVLSELHSGNEINRGVHGENWLKKFK